MEEVVTFYIHVPLHIKNVPVCPGCPVFSTWENAPFKLILNLHKSLKNALKIGKKKSHFTYPSKNKTKQNNGKPTRLFSFIPFFGNLLPLNEYHIKIKNYFLESLSIHTFDLHNFHPLLAQVTLKIMYVFLLFNKSLTAVTITNILRGIGLTIANYISKEHRLPLP